MNEFADKKTPQENPQTEDPKLDFPVAESSVEVGLSNALNQLQDLDDSYHRLQETSQLNAINKLPEGPLRDKALDYINSTIDEQRDVLATRRTELEKMASGSSISNRLSNEELVMSLAKRSNESVDAYNTVLEFIEDSLEDLSKKA